MARESKRRRDERRFGKAERLADLIDFGLHPPVFVEATNVHEYYLSFMKERGSIGLREDIPPFRLPYNDLFVEMKAENLGGIAVGCRFNVVADWADLSELDLPADYLEEASASRMAAFCEIYFTPEKFGLTGPGPWIQSMIYLDDAGQLFPNPIFKVANQFQDRAKVLGIDLIKFAMEAMTPSLLAVAFMNCRNVSTVEHEPDRAINRERRKARLKPFVRYHTINIDPMKKVLRQEGGVESVGLKKALHICRGHFARYTEDRPLFGHFVGTVWKPAHVRGSLEEGVVVSDYAVGKPAFHQPSSGPI